VVIYCRISRDDDGDRAGVDRQAEECSAYVERNKDALELVEPPLVDNDISAFDLTIQRPKFQHILDLLRRGQIDGVVTWAADRLYRRTRDLMAILDIVEELDANFSLYSVNGTDLNVAEPNGRMVATMLAAFGTREVEATSQRLTSKKKAQAANGYYAGGIVPFGYRKGEPIFDSQGHRYVPLEEDPVTAPVLKEAVARFLERNGEHNLAAAARYIESETGEPMSRERFRMILLNPAYTGMRAHWPVKAKRTDRKAGVPLSGNYNKPPGMTLTKAQWPALITASQAKDAKAILAEPSRRRAARPYQAQYLLAGLLRCMTEPTQARDGEASRVHCERPMGHNASADAYKCTKRGGPRDACGKGSIRAVVLEDFIEQEVLRRLAEVGVQTYDPDRVSDALLRRSELEESRAQAQAGLDSLLVMQAKGIYSSEGVAEAEGIYVQRLFDIEAELGRLAHVLVPDLPTYTIDELRDLFGQDPTEGQMNREQRRARAEARRAERMATIEARRPILFSLIREIRVYPSNTRGPAFDPTRVAIWWQGEPEPEPRPGTSEFIPSMDRRQVRQRQRAKERAAEAKAAASR